MYLKDGWHAALQAWRARSLAGAMRGVKKQRPFDNHRNWRLVVMISSARQVVGPEELLKRVSRGVELRECRAVCWRQSRDLHGHVHLLRSVRIIAHDQVEVVVGLAARGIEEALHLDVALFLRHTIRGWPRWYAQLDHLIHAGQ